MTFSPINAVHVYCAGHGIGRDGGEEEYGLEIHDEGVGNAIFGDVGVAAAEIACVWCAVGADGAGLVVGHKPVDDVLELLVDRFIKILGGERFGLGVNFVVLF